jgi:hypothetical protein
LLGNEETAPYEGVRVIWVAVPDDDRGTFGTLRPVTWHAVPDPLRFDGMSTVIAPAQIPTLCRETIDRHRITRTAQLLREHPDDRRCPDCQQRHLAIDADASEPLSLD